MKPVRRRRELDDDNLPRRQRMPRRSKTWIVVLTAAGILLTSLALAAFVWPGFMRSAPPGEATNGTGDKKPADRPGPRGKKDRPQESGQETARLPADVEIRLQSYENVKQLIGAIHGFHDRYKRLPTAAICSKTEGKPLLSWRVAVLPFIDFECRELYKQFKLDEPWDSPNNIKLLPLMPSVFAPVGEIRTDQPHSTFYQVFVGPGTPFEVVPDQNDLFGASGITLNQIIAGTSNVVGVVESAKAVPWTKPADLEFAEGKPLPKLGILKEGVHISFMDGDCYLFSYGLGEDRLRPLIPYSGPRQPTMAFEKFKLAQPTVHLTARQQGALKMKHIMAAMLAYEDVFERFPDHAIRSADGKPLLSWRVALLPFLEYGPLYQQFKLDEPWDSPHNINLVEPMPMPYAPVKGARAARPNETFYQVFVGPGSPFPATGAKIEITDYRPGVIGVIEAAQAVPWTKPVDLPFGDKQPLPRLGMLEGGFHVGFLSGRCEFFSDSMDETTLRSLIPCASGKKRPNLDKFRR